MAFPVIDTQRKRGISPLLSRREIVDLLRRLLLLLYGLLLLLNGLLLTLLLFLFLTVGPRCGSVADDSAGARPGPGSNRTADDGPDRPADGRAGSGARSRAAQPTGC